MFDCLSYVVFSASGTMGDDEMRQLNVPGLQDDGYIFLWVTGIHNVYIHAMQPFQPGLSPAQLELGQC